MSTSRALSNGTLSLRFMQNAQRTKQQATIDLERAKVKDDAEWEISKEIREVWGLSSDSKAQAQKSVIQEASYLPFLFPSLQSGGASANDEAAEEVANSAKVSGRRTFSKGGEIGPSSSSADGPSEENAVAGIKQESNAADLKPIASPSKEHKKPRLAGGPLTGKRTAAKLAALDNRTSGLPIGGHSTADIPVLAMISEETSAAVGMDIRQMRKLKGKEKEKVSDTTADEVKPPVQSPQDTGDTVGNSSIGKGPLSFLRPTGVDSPAPSSVIGKKSKKRVREGECGAGGVAESSGASPRSTAARKKADSEPLSTVNASDNQRQVTKKKKKQAMTEAELSARNLLQ